MAFKTNEKGFDHIIEVEGLRLRAYDDKNPNRNITHASQVEGVLTIGIGHTKTVFVGMEITREKAIQLFKTDVAYFEKHVNRLVTVPITQNMFNALVSFCYNIGEGGFASSTFLRLLNKQDYLGCANAFKMWNIPSVIIGRRLKDKELFLTGSGNLAYESTKKKNGLVLDILKVGLLLSSI